MTNITVGRYSPDEGTIEPVNPLVIRADKAFSVTGVLSTDLGSAITFPFTTMSDRKASLNRMLSYMTGIGF